MPRKTGLILLWYAALAPCACAPIFAPFGDVTGGGNHAPFFLSANAVETPTGVLRLSASAIDPDFDVVQITYEQTAGPFAVEQTQQSTDGALVVELAPSVEGVYTFRITASDAALERSVLVSVMATVTVVGPAPSSGTPAGMRAAPGGDFDVYITGQVIADEGLQAFALSGTLAIRPTTTESGTSITLETAANAAAPSASPGAVILQSQILGADVLTMHLTGNELTVTGPGQPGASSPGQFHTAESGLPRLDIAGVDIVIRFSGDTAAGTILLSSSSVVGDGVSTAPDYVAQFTATRR